MRIAGSSSSMGSVARAASGAWASIVSRSVSRSRRARPGVSPRRSARLASMSRSLGSVRSRAWCISASVHQPFMATVTAPIERQAQNDTSHPALLGPQMATRSPGPTPWTSRRYAATDATWPSVSANVTRRPSLNTQLSRSPWANEATSTSRSDLGRWAKTCMVSPRTSSSASSNGDPGPVSRSVAARKSVTWGRVWAGAVAVTDPPGRRHVAPVLHGRRRRCSWVRPGRGPHLGLRPLRSGHPSATAGRGDTRGCGDGSRRPRRHRSARRELVRRAAPRAVDVDAGQRARVPRRAERRVGHHPLRRHAGHREGPEDVLVGPGAATPRRSVADDDLDGRSRAPEAPQAGQPGLHTEAGAGPRPSSSAICAPRSSTASASRGECDFVWDIAAPLPLLLIGDMLGFPPERYDDLLRWSDDLIRGTTGTPTARCRRRRWRPVWRSGSSSSRSSPTGAPSPARTTWSRRCATPRSTVSASTTSRSCRSPCSS